MPTNDNNTIVHLAAQYNNDKAIQFAISNKIDINLVKICLFVEK
jgi:hypothetical protein